LADDVEIVPQDLYNSGGWAITDAEVDEFRRMTVEKTTLMEVRVFGNDREIIRFGVFPNQHIVTLDECQAFNVC
jgi:hypothetical protein